MVSRSEHKDQKVTSQWSVMKVVPVKMSLCMPAMQIQCRSTAKRKHATCEYAGFHKIDKCEVGGLLESPASSAKPKHLTELIKPVKN